MSNLKNKSDFNFAAASFLQQKSYYASVVHCSYYSCVQLMKHILLHTFNKSEREMDGARRNNNLGPHEYLINEIEKELRNDKKDHRIFQNNITQLKKLRGIADYEDVQIDSKKGDISIQLSDTVLKNLRANFKV